MHALHALHALPDLRVVAGRFAGRVSVLMEQRTFLDQANGSLGRVESRI